MKTKDMFQNKSEMGRHRTDQEKACSVIRKKFTKDYDSQFVADNPILFTDRIAVEKILMRTELFQKTLKVTGSVVECGVANGNSLMLYAQLSSILEPRSFTRKIIGFDSFEDGFIDVTPELDGVAEGELGTSYETLRQAVNVYNRGYAMPQFNKIHLVKGNACETIPIYIKEHPELIISLLYLDFDIYKPTRVALKHLLPLVCKGGVVAFDELNYEKFPGETLALKECLDINSVKLRKFPYSPLVSYFIVGE